MQSTASDVATNLSDLAQRPSVALALEAVREFLGMDVAYTTQIGGAAESSRLDGDAESFGLAGRPSRLTRPTASGFWRDACPA